MAVSHAASLLKDIETHAVCQPAEAVVSLHARTAYDLSPIGVLLTQSLLPQLQQLYYPVQSGAVTSVVQTQPDSSQRVQTVH